MNEQSYEKQITSGNLKRKNEHVINTHIKSEHVNKKQSVDNKLEGINTYSFNFNPTNNIPSGTSQSGRECVKFTTSQHLFFCYFKH
jgi:hypothetical protein